MAWSQVARLLLEAGASPSEHNDRGATVLQWAACRGAIDLVELALQYGADLNARDGYAAFGWTALDCAAHQVRAHTLAVCKQKY